MTEQLRRWGIQAKYAGYIAALLLTLIALAGKADASATAYIQARAVSREEMVEMTRKIDALYQAVVKQECPGGY